MITWLSALLALVCLLLPGSVHAQLREGSLRVYGDVNLASYMVGRRTDSALERGTFAFGPGSGAFAGGAGLGLGYAASARLMPQLYLAYQHVMLRSEPYMEGDEGRQLEARPSLAFSPWPLERVVAHFDLGLSIVHREINNDHPGINFGRFDEASLLGVGPVFTCGAYGFLVRQASLDLGLSFRPLFVRQLKVENHYYDAIETFATRDYALLLNLGISFWPQPGRK